MYSGHGREWNWPGTPLITSTLKCRMCIPSCLRLYLLRFSLAQCSHCFPLSSNVCRNKQLPDLGKSRTSHWPYAHLQIYLISRREARSLLCCLKKNHENQTRQWVWECVETIQCYTNRATAKGKSRKQDSVGAGIVFLICCSGEAGSPVSQVTGERPSITQAKVPGGAIRRGVNYTPQFPRDRGTFGVSQFSGGLLWGCVEKWRGQEALKAAAQPGLPGKDPLAKPTTEVLGCAWLPGAQGNSQPCPWQVPVASCPSVLLQQFLLWALLLLWLMTDACLFVISTPLGFCLTAILCAPLFCVTYCIRFWMSPIQAP